MSTTHTDGQSLPRTHLTQEQYDSLREAATDVMEEARWFIEDGWKCKCRNTLIDLAMAVGPLTELIDEIAEDMGLFALVRESAERQPELPVD